MADPPQTSKFDWLALVLEMEPKRDEPETVYRFSNDREFKSTDRTDSGVYEDE